MTDRGRMIDLLQTSGWNIFTDSASREQCADYLIEHGVIVLPCKVGDIVYVTYQDSQTIEEKRVKSMLHKINESENSMKFICKHNYGFSDTDINIEVFLTREEAEKALKERER